MKKKLEDVKYSSRFALGLFFNESVKLKTSNHPLNFVKGDPIIRFWSIENLKRTGEFEGPTSVVMHTGIDFGAENSDKDKDSVKPVLLQKATDVVPEAANVSENSVKSHKWKYSQVNTFAHSVTFYM